MKKTYIKKFSPNTTYKEMREFEIDILGDPEKIHEDDDIDSDTYGDIIKGKPIFSSQATAQQATFFGSRFIDGW